MRSHLVTGVTSGIGRAIAKRLTEEGDRVIPVLRNEDQRTLFPEAQEVVACDFENPVAVAEAFGRLNSRIDSFINCAGIILGKNLFESSLDDLRKTINVNMLSCMVAVQKVLPNLNENGLIILMSSQSAFKGSYDDAYAITKGAIHVMVKTLAPKLAPQHRILCLAPGMTDRTRIIDGFEPEYLDRYRKNVPLQRFATPEEIAGCVYFLLSPYALSMTGCTIDINGGNVLR